MRRHPILGALIGYIVAIIGNGNLPTFIALFLPVLGAILGIILGKKDIKVNIPDVVPVAEPRQADEPANDVKDVKDAKPGDDSDNRNSEDRVDPIFQPVVEYLGILEDMVISEGQKNNLDSEIVEKSCSLFLRLQRVIPLLSELKNGDINHTVKRLVLNELNSVIQPFLRLSGEAKIKNRRVLLNGLKDVNTKISDIVATIEHKDLLELQTRAEILHSRYANS